MAVNWLLAQYVLLMFLFGNDQLVYNFASRELANFSLDQFVNSFKLGPLNFIHFTGEWNGICSLINKFLQCKSWMVQQLYSFIFLLVCAHTRTVYPKGCSLNITSCYCTIPRCAVLQQPGSRDKLESLTTHRRMLEERWIKVGEEMETAKVTREGSLKERRTTLRYTVRKKQDMVKCDVDDVLFFLLSLLSPLLIFLYLLTPSFLFSSPCITSPVWLSTSAASNSLSARANLEGICSPIKVHVQCYFHPFPLMFFFFSRSPPANTPPLLASHQ